MEKITQLDSPDILTPEGDLKDPYRGFIAKSKYNRWLEEEGRRETWVESVNRYVDWMVDYQKKRGVDTPKDLVEDIRHAITYQHVMPSMRALMTAGPALEKNHIASFNCAFTAVDSVRAFDEALIILMHGTGLGYSVENKYIDKLPEVAESFHKTTTVVRVEDSKEGWAKALKEWLALLWSGQIPTYDVSKVRPKGARLKTFGGQASGPQPLVDLFEFTKDLLINSSGRRITNLEAHDIMCKIAEVVVVGSVRRSALISLSDLGSRDLAEAKSGAWWVHNPQRAMANNSAVYTKRPNMETFFREWKTLYDSKSGERGIFNLDAIRKHVDKAGRRDSSLLAGVNPSLIAGTRVFTTKGIKNIEDLENKNFKVRNLHGEISSAYCWKSGVDEEVLEVGIKGKHKYTATPKHKWPVWDGTSWVKKRTDELVKGDRLPNLRNYSLFPEGTRGSYDEGFLIGWNLGDGWITSRPAGLQIGFIVGPEDRAQGIDKKLEGILSALGSKANFIGKDEINVNNNRVRELFASFDVRHKSEGLPLSVWDSEVSDDFRKGVIDGLFSSDGYVNSNRLGLIQASEKMIRDVSSLLGFFGVKTNIHRQETTAGKAFPTKYSEDAKDKKFASWTLRVGEVSNLRHFAEIFTLSHTRKQLAIQEILDKDSAKEGLTGMPGRRFPAKDWYVEVEYVTPAENADVWDITVEDETHAFQIDHCVTGNCGEVPLRDKGLCNLSSIVVHADDTPDTLKEKARIATVLGTWQASLTEFKYLRRKWRDNAQEEALLGVSMTGIFGHALLNGSQGLDSLSTILDDLREYVIGVNKEEAARIGINQSAAISTVKPEGCRPANGLVTTEEGIYTLEELLAQHPEGEKWADLPISLTSLQGDHLLRTYRNGVAPVWKVTLGHGLEVESTPNHQWYVKGKRTRSNASGWDRTFTPGWYRTDELEPDFVLDVTVGNYSNTVEADLTPDSGVSLVAQAKRWKLPSEVSADFAWLMGYLWGDGALSPHKSRIRFIDQHRYNLEKVHRIFLTLFGYEGKINRCTDRDAYTFEMGSVEIYNYLINNGFWKYQEDGSLADIPLPIRRSSYTSVLAFIAGLIDSDGCVYKQGPGRRGITIATAQESFAKHLQQVALSVGIALGRSHNTQGENLQKEKSIWLLTTNKHTDNARLEVMAQHMEKASHVLPDLVWSPTVNTRANVLGKVLSVEFDRYEETFDVEVENSHWFHAGAIKSHNTASQLTGTSSGIHPWYAHKYARRVRGNNEDPLVKLMKDAGVPNEPELNKPLDTTVFTFPLQAPEGSVVGDDITAIEHLELWRTYRNHWTEHNPSVTITVREDEWLEVGAYVYKHFDEMSGVSFLPDAGNHTYQQAPFEKLDDEAFQALVDSSVPIPWDKLGIYELEDATTGTQELACVAGACEVVDLETTDSETIEFTEVPIIDLEEVK